MALSFEPIQRGIVSLIETAIGQAQTAGDLPNSLETALDIPVKPAKQSNYASPVAMAAAKIFKMKPLDVANAIAKHLPSDERIKRTEVSPPGFINFYLNDEWICKQVEAIIAAGDEVFQLDIGQNRQTMVEFVSANPTGPLHIGRARGAVVGDAIARLLEITGWNVHREYYFNNGGRQMEMLGRSLQVRYLQELGQQVELPEDGYQGDYLTDYAKELIQEQGEAWKDKDWDVFKVYAEKAIFADIAKTLERIGIRFDVYFNELSLYEDHSLWKVRDALEKRGHLYEAVTRDGASEEEVVKAKREKWEAATWFRSTTFGDTEDRVIVRGNGDPTYVLPDIAYHVNKLERGFERVVDIFGSDHFTEAQTVNRGLQALGLDAEKVEVVLTQWVHLIRDGEKDAGSTRRGAIITVDEVVDEVGVDSLRYFMLNRSADNTINFDLDLAVKQSNENPVYYIQNAHVRCAGILRQLEERGYADDWDVGADLSLLNEEEMEFVLKMLELPEQLVLAHDNLAPHQIAFWALDLARAFHPMYERSRVLHSEVEESVAMARMRLFRAAKVVFKRVLILLGMRAPEAM